MPIGAVVKGDVGLVMVNTGPGALMASWNVPDVWSSLESVTVTVSV
jgi:hypothetical protein